MRKLRTCLLKRTWHKSVQKVKYIRGYNKRFKWSIGPNWSLIMNSITGECVRTPLDCSFCYIPDVGYWPYIRIKVVWNGGESPGLAVVNPEQKEVGLFDLHGKFKYEGVKVSTELEEQARSFLKKYAVLMAGVWNYFIFAGDFEWYAYGDIPMLEVFEDSFSERPECTEESYKLLVSEYNLAKQEGRYSDLPDDEQDLKILEDIVRQNHLYDLYDESPKGLGRLVETDKLNFSFDFSIKGGVGRTFRAKVSWDRERPVGKSQYYFELYGDYKYVGKKVKPELEEEARAFFRKYQVLLAAVWAGILEKDSLYDYFYDSLPFAELLPKFKLSAQELAKVNQMLNHAKKRGLYSNLPEDIQNLKILANIVRERRLYYLPK